MTASTGIITTIAGTGASSYSGDNGPATSAALNSPFKVALDASGIQLQCQDILIFPYSLHHLGNVYIADRDNCRIRKVTVSTGIITTIAGTGNNGYSGDNGQATAAELKDPIGIAVDSAGILVCNIHFLVVLSFLPSLPR